MHGEQNDRANDGSNESRGFTFSIQPYCLPEILCHDGARDPK
jgi:hypothetical protein